MVGKLKEIALGILAVIAAALVFVFGRRVSARGEIEDDLEPEADPVDVDVSQRRKYEEKKITTKDIDDVVASINARYQKK